MIDLNHGSGYVPVAPAMSVNDRVNISIDLALTENQEEPRAYLGASRLGEPCDRKLCYELMLVPHDPGREFDGRTMRIFGAGHQFETLMVSWLRSAGFELVTARKNGEQFGFSVAGGKIAGHIDGAILSGPPLGISYPMGWENKALNDKGWSKIAKDGLRIGNEEYYAQVQVYMAYMELEHVLFTALNKNDQRIHAEIVKFDPATAQALSDRAVKIVRAVERGELLPRMASSRDFYRCRWCSRQDRCWSDPA